MFTFMIGVISRLIMKGRNCLCPSTHIFLNGQTKQGRSYLLPNFRRALNFTIFMGPILRRLIVFGIVSISSLGYTMVTLEMCINYI